MRRRSRGTKRNSSQITPEHMLRAERDELLDMLVDGSFPELPTTRTLDCVDHAQALLAAWRSGDLAEGRMVS